MAEGFDAREHYTKYEYRIPMRDGVRLFTSVHVPKDASTPYPFMLLRSPFRITPYGEDEFSGPITHTDLFLEAGYIWVRQDVRGRGLSEGDFTHVTPHRPSKSGSDVDESTDTYDTVEWLLQHISNNNGRVGIWGISYVGFFAAAGIIDTHPAIKAASPQAPVADLFHGDDWYHGGAFMLAANFGAATSFPPEAGPPPKVDVPFDYGTSDGYEFFLRLATIANMNALIGGTNAMWDETIAHPTYDDYWQERSIWKHLKNIRCPVLTVGGWFDAEDLAGPLRVYDAVAANNPGLPNTLVMGPWVHGGWARYDGRRLGHVDFAADTAQHYRKNVLLPFFDFHLKDRDDPQLPGAYVFETGTNVWRSYAAWPPPGVTTKMLYFGADGGLGFDPPTEPDAGDVYVSDPARPVPFVGYITPEVPEEHMVADQRFAAQRPDVLVYMTEPLQEDLTLAGPLSPRLFVSTSGTDADWIVKLIDVYPSDRSQPPGESGPATDVGPTLDVPLAGFQQLVRGWPFRGKYRNSMRTPEPFVPDQVETVAFTIPDINHVFRRGHRVMVQVQSTWFPLVDRNPQTFVSIPTAKPEDFRAAANRVVRSVSQPSGIEVSVLPGDG